MNQIIEVGSLLRRPFIRGLETLITHGNLREYREVKGWLTSDFHLIGLDRIGANNVRRWIKELSE